MATKTRFLPGYGVLVDAESGNERMVPGWGAVAQVEVASGPLDNDRISSMHCMRHYEPIAMGT